MAEYPLLYCGDCRQQFKNANTGSVDLIVTAPPYGLGYRSNRQSIDRVKSVNGEGDHVIREYYFDQSVDDKRLFLDWIREAYRVLKDGCALYILCHWTKWGEVAGAVTDAGFHVKNMIVLNKSNHGAGDTVGAYSPKYELMLFAAKGRHELIFPNGRIPDVWPVNIMFSGARRLHPNEKPVSWIIPVIENSSKEGDVVMDPFMGSGTFGVAACQMGRRFMGSEIESEFFEIAKKRIEEAIASKENSLF